MQKLSGYLRKAITDYNMIEEGDRIVVGVSGGKDSMALVAGLVKLREFLGINFELVALTLDPCWKGVETDFSAVTDYFNSIGVKHIIKRTEIGTVIFDIRQETNPCSLCARMRRGALHDMVNELGFNKIALGHHYDDAVETFVMNLFNEGRIGCFSPVTYLSRKDIYMIRPLVYAPEGVIKSAVKRHNIPVVKSECPVDGTTKRQWTKEFLLGMEKNDRGFKKRLFGAMRRGEVSGWKEASKVKFDDEE